MTEETILQLFGNYGTVALLFAWFLYQYFKEKKIADTLKGANTDRKTDTDEVARKLNNEQEVCLAEMRKDIEFIKLQVSNHLPTAIKELAGDLKEHIQKQDLFEREVLVKLK